MTSDVTFIIFGATGNLATTKLLPALARVVLDTGLTSHAVIGIGARQRSDAEFTQIVRRSLEGSDLDEDCVEKFLRGTLGYQAVSDISSFDALDDRVQATESKAGLSGNRVFYLAVPPSRLDQTIEGIACSSLADSRGWARLVVEKPFGVDLASAKRSNQIIHDVFSEDQVYRIDHFLGKETVRNLLVFRFANALFEHTWDRNHIESVEITVAEDGGVGTRSGYYEESGAVRDMVQNHLTQILTLIAMEPPVAMTADAIRSEKVKVLQSARPIAGSDAVLGRYTNGQVNGVQVRGYLEESGVSEESTTPTFAAMRLFVDNWRWQGIPFYLRTGKRMSTRATQVVVRFARPPICLVHAPQACPGHQNTLTLRLQPDESFELLIDVKRPGAELDVEQIPLNVSYDDILGDTPDAYETLLADVIAGDQTLFVRSDEVEASWKLYEPILDRTDLEPYAPGTDGPESAELLITTHPEKWTPLERGTYDV